LRIYASSPALRVCFALHTMTALGKRGIIELIVSPLEL
jgi:hypothetical protein